MDIYDICVTEYPRYPTETDDSPRINRAIQDCPNGILYIPKYHHVMFMRDLTKFLKLFENLE